MTNTASDPHRIFHEGRLMCTYLLSSIRNMKIDEHTQYYNYSDKEITNR